MIQLQLSSPIPVQHSVLLLLLCAVVVSSYELRLVTYNIQAWRDSNHDCNFERIVQTIQDLKPDILCLNEVLHPFCKPNRRSENDGPIRDYYQRVKAGRGRDTRIDPDLFVPKDIRRDSFLYRLASETGLDATIEFIGATDRHSFGCGVEFGNAILTHLETATIQHCLLDDVSLQEELTFRKNNNDLPPQQSRDFIDPRVFSTYQIKMKPLLAAANDNNEPTIFGVAATHLDHKSEEVRELQIRKGLQETIITSGDTSNAPALQNVSHLICGDFNTFQKQDCDLRDRSFGNGDKSGTKEKTTWDTILELYDENNWPAPYEKSLVLETLREYGYEDTWYIAQDRDKNEFPEFTAWSHRPLMRIDHVFLKNDVNSKTSLSVQDHFRADSNHDGSDHFPVVVDFRVENVKQQGQ